MNKASLGIPLLALVLVGAIPVAGWLTSDPCDYMGIIDTVEASKECSGASTDECVVVTNVSSVAGSSGTCVPLTPCTELKQTKLFTWTEDCNGCGCNCNCAYIYVDGVRQNKGDGTPDGLCQNGNPHPVSTEATWGGGTVPCGQTSTVRVEVRCSQDDDIKLYTRSEVHQCWGC